MRNVLEGILVSAILKSLGMNNDLDLVSLNKTIELLVSQDNIMQKIPFKVLKSIDGLQCESCDDINFYPQKGILLYDGIYGAAGGRGRYFYKSKGIRVFLFADKKIEVVSTYCTIDESGFSLHNESIDDFLEIKDNEACNSLLNYMDVGNDNIPLQMIKFITNIKKPFIVDYYIEYLLFPPDVNVLSEFSFRAGSLLWEICLSNEFKEYWGQKFVNTAISLLISINILPPSLELLQYIRNSANANFEDLMKSINYIKDTIEKHNNKNLVSTLNIGVGPLGVGIDTDVLCEKVKKYFRNNKVL